MSLIDTFRKNADGSIDYHPLKEFIRPITFNPNPPNNIINLAAGGRSQLVPLTAREDGHLFLTKMMCQRTGDATIRFYDPSRCQYWSNNEVHIDTIVGNGAQPGLLPETVFIKATQSLQFEVRNITLPAVPNTIEFAFGAAKLYHLAAPQDEVAKLLAQKQLLTFPYWQTPDNGAFIIPAGGVSQQFSTIASQFDIEIFAINSVSDENFRFDIRYRGDMLANNAQVNNLVGTGVAGFPYVLPTSFLVKRNEVLELNFTNLSPINPNTVWFTMIGRAIVLHE